MIVLSVLKCKIIKTGNTEESSNKQFEVWNLLFINTWQLQKTELRIYLHNQSSNTTHI